MAKDIIYSLIDRELEEILDKNKDDKDLHKHKDRNQNKGYALLIWFLNFYAQKPIYQTYITEGSGDNSCDIIFENIDSSRKIFYVIQSKWINYNENSGSYPVVKKEEFNAVLTEFNNMLSGKKPESNNEKFNKKYGELTEHLERNGLIKFIFFSLAEYRGELQDSISTFNANHGPNIKLELIDINKIKKDYIEFRFKELEVNNPLEYRYDPEDTEIDLEIQRVKVSDGAGNDYLKNRDILEFNGRAKAYIFLLKPSTIYNLFKQYRFSLFYKNVRNPLRDSEFNKQIVETLLTKPDAFWFYNNGITAITKVEIPDIGKHATSVKVNGLQIINGAQTVYSVYQAYEQATEIQRKSMDSDARINLRLIRSSNEDFNLEITRFTNRQNPMEARDFVANQKEQIRLQKESFDYNIWYEKRRNEFRDEELISKNKIRIISNVTFAKTHAAFNLQKPKYSISNEDKFFISRKEDPEGLYDELFNPDTKYEDMLASFLMWESVFEVMIAPDDPDDDKVNRIARLESFIEDLSMPLLALTKTLLGKYLNLKFKSDKPININLFIRETYEKNKEDNFKILSDITAYTLVYIMQKFPASGEENDRSRFIKFMYDTSFFDYVKQEFDDKDIKTTNIEGAFQRLIEKVEKPEPKKNNRPKSPNQISPAKKREKKSS